MILYYREIGDHYRVWNSSWQQDQFETLTHDEFFQLRFDVDNNPFPRFLTISLVPAED